MVRNDEEGLSPAGDDPNLFANNPESGDDPENSSDHASLESENDSSLGEEAIPTASEPDEKKSKTLNKKKKKAGTMTAEGKIWTDIKYQEGINTEIPEMKSTVEFVEEFMEKVVREGFSQVCSHLKGRKLRVATACSGTEAPILFLNQLSDGLKKAGYNFEIEHVFSIEIEPYKQNYIRRNFPGVIIFRDITEALEWEKNPELKGFMTTAFGALVPLPPRGSIDLVLAGTSCTSYSTLNKNREMDLERDQNESSRTFRAYAKLIRQLQPYIAISENVGSGPFPAMLKMLKDHGYLGGWSNLDSKHFGIPQTRQRGYLIAVLESSLPADDATKYSKPKEWKALFISMKAKFSRDASTRIEQWMESSDSKSLRAQVELQGDVRALPNWDTCHARHEDYRHGQGLGTGKPITDWRSTGVFRHLDFWIKGMKGFVERVHDATDISHLRGVSRGYDDRYISRNIDLSQNVYVQHDTVKDGIMSCLTPTGAMFNTARGSKITGEEALRLQGIDTAGLELAGLSQPELRNFAGNAMTTTVVGAVTTFSLLTFFSILPPGVEVDTPMEDVAPKTFREENMLLSRQNITIIQQTLTVGECIYLVEASAKFCYCEAQTDISRSAILKCKFCGHVACSSCGVKPRHAYEPLAQYVGPRGVRGITPRIDPAYVHFNVADRLPMLISVSALFTSDRNMVSFLQQLTQNGIDSEQWKALRTPVLNCLQSTVKFQQPVRSFTWNFTWLADNAKLELVLAENKVQWFLYAVPQRSLPVNSPLRKYLTKFPIARTVPTYAFTHSSSSMFDCTWQLWQSKTRVAKAEITYGGHLIPSYRNSIGIPIYKGDLVWSEMSINIPQDQLATFEDVVGVWVSRPECGQAFDSMHTKEGTILTDRHMYMFFDHESGTGDWNLHGFVFTDDPARKESGVFRQATAELDCSWEKPVVRILNDGYQFKDTFYEDLPTLRKGMREAVDVISRGSWITPAETVNLMALDIFDNSFIVEYQKLDPFNPQLLNENDCKNLLTAFTCKALTDGIPHNWPVNCWTQVTKQNGIHFYRDCYHLLARGLVHPGITEADPPWIPGSTQEDYSSRCRECAPLKPNMLWHLKRNGVRIQQTPFESPDAAARFEFLTKSSPPATEQWVRFLPVDNGFQFEYNCLINPSSLSHKAADLLDAFPRPNVPVFLSWRFVPGSSGNNRVPTPKFVFSSTDQLSMSQQPSRFVPDMKLRNEQLKTLTWMVNQERYPPIFMEREIVESRQEDLAFRLEGRASRSVRHRAGLLAAAVGYGKTVMTFALMSRQYYIDRLWSQRPNTDGFLHLKATLALVPTHLTLQWRSEVCMFLGWEPINDPRLLVVSNCKQAQALTVDDYLRAELIIYNSSLFDNEGYLKLVAKNAGVVELAKNSSDRAKEAWYIHAKEERKANLLRLRQELPMVEDESDKVAGNRGVDNFGVYMNEKFVQNFEESGANEPHIPSRRLQGAALKKKLADNESDGKGKGKEKFKAGEDDAQKCFARPEFSNNSIRGLRAPTLMDFAWPRIVTDEVSYNTGNQIAVGIRELTAQSRWALSATPNIIDHLSASRIARCLGINLGVDDQETVRKDKNLTSAERFLSYGPEASSSWNSGRIQIAQEFCDIFVRQDKRKGTGQFNRVHSFIETSLATAQLACYLTIKSDVINKSYIMPKTVETRSAVQEELLKVYGKEPDGRMRLTKAASFFPEHAGKTVGFDYTLKTCKDLKSIALSEINIAKDNVRRHMELIHFLLALPEVNDDPDMRIRFNNWRDQIISGQRFADPDALRDLTQVIEAVEQAPRKTRNELYFTVPYSPHGRRLWPSPTLKIMHNGRKMMGIMADCRRALTDLHKTSMDIMNSRSEYRYYKAVLKIDQAGKSSPTGSLTCDKCTNQTTLTEAVVQGNCGHLLCAPCNVLLKEGLCPVTFCGGSSLDDQKYSASSLYSSAGNSDPAIDSEISNFKALVQSLPLDPSSQPRDSDYEFWSKPDVRVDKIEAVRSIIWENDDGRQKFIIFSPLREFLVLAQKILTADGIPCSNLNGKKSEIAQILENFKNNKGRNYREGSTKKRAPRKVAPVTDVPAKVPLKRKRADSEDVTLAPVAKVAKVESPRFVREDSEDIYGVSDREIERVRVAGLKKKNLSTNHSAQDTPASVTAEPSTAPSIVLDAQPPVVVEPSTAPSIVLDAQASVTAEPSTAFSIVQEDPASITVKPSTAPSIVLDAQASVTAEPSTAFSIVQEDPASVTIEPSTAFSIVQKDLAFVTVEPSTAPSIVLNTQASVIAEPSTAFSIVQEDPASITVEPSLAPSTVQDDPTSIDIEPSPVLSTVQEDPASLDVEPSPDDMDIDDPEEDVDMHLYNYDAVVPTNQGDIDNGEDPTISVFRAEWKSELEGGQPEASKPPTNDESSSQPPKKHRQKKRKRSTDNIDLAFVTVVPDTFNPADYMMSGGLGFADVVDPDDQSAPDRIYENALGTVYHPVYGLLSNDPALTNPPFIETPMASYPPLDPSDLEDDEVAAPEVLMGADHPDDLPVDWERVAQETAEPDLEEDLDPSARVLLLDITDESASGSNLTVAQHVIFLTPYFAEKTRYNAAMTQAMGRALRQGQEIGNTVTVHHLLVKDTVEMDIAYNLMDDDFPGRKNAESFLAARKSNIGPAFFRK
ncbi:hypothetical protein NHQ30_002040 [Ciborinia camelliae]|nr:hypothetical protein NHQ30_002040 [Ciborinia camelliae]